jgi:hypothetical protein
MDRKRRLRALLRWWWLYEVLGLAVLAFMIWISSGVTFGVLVWGPLTGIALFAVMCREWASPSFWNFWLFVLVGVAGGVLARWRGQADVLVFLQWGSASTVVFFSLVGLFNKWIVQRFLEDRDS